MIVHFAISARVRVYERLVLRGAPWAVVGLPVRYGIVLHPDAGPVLIDTGYHPGMMTVPAGLALRAYRRLMPPDFDAAGQPATALGALGVQPADVRHIVLTHLHADHVAGLVDFPQARVHVAPEIARLLGRGRRLPAGKGVFAELVPRDLAARAEAFPDPTAQSPLGPAADILGDGTLLAVALPGHALGHCGIWVAPSELLYATDTAWTMPGLMEDRETRLAVAAVADDRRAAARSAARVRRFAEDGGRVVLCHDPAPCPEDLP
ncbi:MBL fold metallo-hydrolase [Roseisalinus antarcticus]|uniref:4-pyridoxolactonase n=1 Tax=Roseisalinus antarcticus TaxID=254357 RepID=A0A1Y5SEZ2_9RHOB|nr:MBL fold metallo-hydrolase [Roseisalinus antarcticus]SLN37599.1 4-pyridoxolactonase [Roseisalinus antarcticus]